MEVSVGGALQLQNQAAQQATNVGLMRKGLDVQQDMATQLIEGMTEGSVNTKAAAGSQVNLIA